jgi:hypothetical protein
MGLEEIGVVTSPFIQVDSQLRTNKRHIFAIGDVNGLSMLDSGACAQARIAVDVIMGGDSLFDARWVPRYLDTEPPAAAVGWMEADAIEAGLELDVRPVRAQESAVRVLRQYQDPPCSLATSVPPRLPPKAHFLPRRSQFCSALFHFLSYLTCPSLSADWFGPASREMLRVLD